MLHSRSRLVFAFVASLFLLLTFNNCSEGFKTVADANEVLSASTDTSGTTDGTTNPDTQTPPVVNNGKINVFVGYGYMGRTLRSCDDGKTWIDDKSQNDAARCYVATTDPGYVDCDHTPYTPVGLDSGDGWTYAQFGWGQNGSIQRSKDGANWETVRTGSWGGGLTYLNGFLFSTMNGWISSNDQGKTYAKFNVSGSYLLPFIGHVGNTLIISGRDGATNTYGMSNDMGKTWFYPTIPADWKNSGMAAGKGLLVAIGVTYGTPNVGHIAISTDQGETWTRQEAFNSTGQIWNRGIIFDGKEFTAISKGRLWRSQDGKTWQDEQAYLDGVAMSTTITLSAAYSDKTGTQVAYLSAYGTGYGKQRFYRSPDGGVHWTTLASTQYKASHPLRRIVAFEADPSACPAGSQ